MANEKTLVEMIREAAGSRPMTIYQGIVKSVDGEKCTVTFGSLDVSDIRLRASLANVDKPILLTPKAGSAVVVGSLSGDFAQMAVLQMDEVDSIEIGSSDDAVKIELNGGELGGLVKIEELTDQLKKATKRIDKIIDALTNSSTGSQDGGAAYKAGIVAVISGLDKESWENLEDENITH